MERGEMTNITNIGLRLHGGLDPRHCVELARAAEANNFASVWFAENPFERGVLPTAAACAAATERIRIGIGVWNPFNRHPTLINRISSASLPGLTRQSILFARTLCEKDGPAGHKGVYARLRGLCPRVTVVLGAR
jgi:hypothetical protein